MKKQIFLSLLLVAIVTISILIGCGGNNNGITPSLISTPTVNPSGYGYLTITVVWPQGQSNSNKLIISSSKDGKNLIASSVPYGTTQIVVTVYDEKTYVDLNDYTKLIYLPNGIHTFNWDPSYIGPTAPVEIGPLPAIDAIVRADAFGIDEAYITHVYTKVNIEPGTHNLANIDLGNYSIGLTPTVPGPSDTGDAVINTNLSIVHSTPTGTPATAPSPQPVGNKKIKFTVENVTYTGTDNVIVTPADIHVDPELTTDPSGNCKAMVKADKKPVKATIKAMLVGLDGQDTDISKTCEVTIGDNYELTVDPNTINITLPPLFKRNANAFGGDETPVPEDTPTPVNITATLKIVYPTPAPNSTSTPKPPKPVTGKLITFEIIEGNDEGTYLSLYPSLENEGSIVSGFTLDPNGEITATLTTSTAGYKTIKASFQPDPNDPNSIYSDKCYVTVIQPLPPPTETPEPTTEIPEPTATPGPTSTPYPPPTINPLLTGTWVDTKTADQYTIELTGYVLPPDSGIVGEHQPFAMISIKITGSDGSVSDGYASGDNIFIRWYGGIWGYIYYSGTQYPGHPLLQLKSSYSRYGNFPGALWYK
jgi:hypothetical protein